MKLSRTVGISVLIMAIAVTMAACKYSGGAETTSASSTTRAPATTGVPATTTEPATTGVQTTPANNDETSANETSGFETSPSEMTSIEVTTSLPVTETSVFPTATQPGTTIPAPTTTQSVTTAATTSHTATAQPTTTVPATTTISATKFWSYGENLGWQQNGIKLGIAYTGRVKISFDMTSPEKAGASVGFADQDTAVGGYDDLVMLVRMNEGTATTQGEDANGYFDASSNDMYDHLAIAYYHANITYHVEIDVNFATKTYDAWVTTPEGGRTKIAEGYDFKYAAASTADDIGQVFVISKFANDLVYIQNLKAAKTN